MDADERQVTVGRIASAHGIRGEVAVAAYTESDEFFRPGKSLGAKGPGAKPESLTIASARPHKKGFIIAFEGFSDRNRAESYAGRELFVDRDELPEPEPGEYYWTDLLGMEVVTRQGEVLGRLASIIETGANDVFEVKDEESGKETLLPALDWVILSVDTDAGRITVEVPEGL